jgi:hypothetical protein
VVSGVHGRQQTNETSLVDRVDAATVRLVGAFDTQSMVVWGRLAAGLGSVWLIQPQTGDLLRIDPARV